jgi:hypothetical protein
VCGKFNSALTLTASEYPSVLVWVDKEMIWERNLVIKKVHVGTYVGSINPQSPL